MKKCALLLVLVAACGKKEEATKTPPAPDKPTPTVTADAAAPTPPDPGSGSADPGSGSGSAAPATAGTIVKDVGFETPESVLYDADADLYLVSNINGKPTEADDNGFISKLGPDGKIVELKWIDGTKENVKLDAPKGSAISNGILWVADITTVRKFDAKTGEPKGEVKLEGATFVNDVAAGADGTIYVTDTGVDASFKPTGPGAVWAIKDDKATKLSEDKDLGNPNGVVVYEGTVWINTLISGATMSIGTDGKPSGAQKAPTGMLDGMIALPGGEIYVSSWEGKTVYKKSGSAEWTDLKLGIEAPADFGYDTKRKALLVPHFMGNQVSIIPQ